MPKSKRKKNVDFQKVKLKVGKKLPKGDNVTNLSFKTRQIQLTQRIRDGDSKELTTKRHLSIQDLLRQCEHHSCNSRVNAISGLKEVWLIHHEELMVMSNIHGYGEILKKLSGMLIDNEAVVRHAVINLFKLIFSKVSSQTKSRGSPMIGGDLFKHIHAFLCCAMNHIHEDVRLDSLVLFDALLNSFPQFMVQHTGDLLKNLVAMISSPMSLGSKGNATTRKLSMNPESKLLAMKFRGRVLERIKNALQEALNSSNKNEVLSSEKSNFEEKQVWSFHFDAKDNTIRQSTVIVPQTCRKRFQLIFAGVTQDMDHSILNPGNLEALMHQSLPVLLQCWREARANTSDSFATEKGVSSDSVDVMALVLAVINLIFSLASKSTSDKTQGLPNSHMIQPSILVQNYCSDFTSVFMSQFPFSVQIETQASKKNKKKKKSSVSIENSVTRQSLVALNLDICHVMSCFCADMSATLGDMWLRKIEAYLIQIMQGSSSSGQCHIIEKILKNIYLNPKALDHCGLAFKAAWDFYCQVPVQSPDKKVLFNLFSDMLTTWDGWMEDVKGPKPLCLYHHNTKVEEILNAFKSSLPSLLQDIPRLEDNFIWIEKILCLLSSSMSCSVFTSHVEDYLGSIFHPKTGLLAMDHEKVQSKVLSLLTHGPVLRKEHLQHILYSIRRPVASPLLSHRKSQSMACQAIGCIAQGIKKSLPFTSQEKFNSISPSQHEQLSNYLKFLFSLQIGMNKEELDELIPCHTSSETMKDAWLSVNLVVSNNQWERHTAIATYVAAQLTDLYIPTSPSEGYMKPFTFIGNMEHLWIQSIETHKGINIMSAYSLIKFVHLASLPHAVEKPSAKLYNLTSLVISCVLSSLYTKEVKSLGLGENIVDDLKSEMISCLRHVPCLMHDTWSKLKQRSEGKGFLEMNSEDKQSAIMALELLRSEDALMQDESPMEIS